MSELVDEKGVERLCGLVVFAFGVVSVRGDEEGWVFDGFEDF